MKAQELYSYPNKVNSFTNARVPTRLLETDTKTLWHKAKMESSTWCLRALVSILSAFNCHKAMASMPVNLQKSTNAG